MCSLEPECTHTLLILNRHRYKSNNSFEVTALLSSKITNTFDPKGNRRVNGRNITAIYSNVTDFLPPTISPPPPSPPSFLPFSLPRISPLLLSSQRR